MTETSVQMMQKCGLSMKMRLITLLQLGRELFEKSRILSYYCRTLKVKPYLDKTNDPNFAKFFFQKYWIMKVFHAVPKSHASPNEIHDDQFSLVLS